MKKKLFICLLLSLGLGLPFVLSVNGSESLRRPRTARPTTAQGADSIAPQGQSATLLPDGRILLLGGQGPKGPLSTAAIQDPQTRAVTTLAVKLQEARAYHTATLLPDGTVLIFGGIGNNGSVLDIAESFVPTTQTFQTLPSTGLAPRAHHTATLLTAGLVFVAGGVTAGDGTIGTAQLWDFRTNTTTNVSKQLVISRLDQTATLLADGTVLLSGGVQGNGLPAPASEIFDSVSSSFRIETSLPSTIQDSQVPQLEESIPAVGADGIAVDTFVAMRFSKPLLVPSVNVSTASISNAQENVPAKVIPAEGGMLAFVTPIANLLPGTSYTVTLSGLTDPSGSPLPNSTFSFTTAGGTPNNAAGLQGNSDTWPGGPEASPWAKLPPLQAPPGVTALAGQILLLDGHPLADVALRVGKLHAETDSTGRFLLRDVPAGHAAMVIDGRAANTRVAKYGVFEDGVDFVAGQTTALKYTVWMPTIDTAHAVRIPVPTIAEVVVTTPLIPGLEFHIPAGTTITDIDGNTVREVSITPIPISQPPFPLPPGVNVPIYFTIQPGGGYLWVKNAKGPDGGWLVYPNSFRQPVGSRFDFWNYNADNNGWYIYGHGSVSANGNSIVPDPGVLVYELTGAMAGGGGLAGGNGPGCSTWIAPILPWCSSGDPVDLGTGLFVYQKTDLYLPDVIPINLTRAYRQNDVASRAFGVGTSHSYDIFLVGDVNPYTYLELVMADGARVLYTRTAIGTGFADAIYRCNYVSGPFFGSTIAWNGIGWSLTRRDGTVYQFPDGFFAKRGQQAALLSIRDRNGNVLTVTRDSNSNITQITSPNGRWIQFSYDSNYRVTQAQDNIGRTVQYSYDSLGRLTSVVDANAGTWKYTYDTSNNMTSLVDPRGITYLQNQYGDQNRLTIQTLADGTSAYQFTYVEVTSPKCPTGCNLGIAETDVVDPNGNTKKVKFNLRMYFPGGYATGGTSSSATFAAGTSVAQTVSYQYQPGTNLLLSTTDPLSRVTSYAYDALGNLTGITRLSGTSGAVTTSLTYEPVFNQLTSVTDPLNHSTSLSYDNKGNPTVVTDPNGNASRFAYDSEGRPVSAADPLSETTNFAYDGPDLASVTDPLGRSFQFFSDAAGRPLSKIDPFGQIAKYIYNPLNQVTQIIDPMGATTSLSYDGNGNLLTVTDANSHTTSYAYDNRDRLSTRTDPLLNAASFGYDAADNLTQFTDRRGKIAKFTYDALNRRTFAGFGYQAGPTYESTISYSYDAGNRPTSIVDSVAGTITPSFDNLNRMTSVTTPQGTVGYAYDLAGRRTQMTVAGQAAVNYSYDDASRLTQIAQGSSTSVSFAYDSANRRTSLTLPNGVVMGYSYDIGSQLTSVNYQLGSNNLGNLAYEYDQLGRRLQVTGSLAHTGLPSAVTTTTYNAANQLTQWGSASPSYDANGNMTSDGTNTFTWSARNQLVSMNSGSNTFQYDAVGRRAGKAISSTATNYLYDGVNTVQELSGSTVTANLLSGGIDEVFVRTDSNGQANFLSDALGSALQLTNSSGNSLVQYAYEPFGKTTVTSGSSTNSFQYTGRENDGTGVYFYRGRYYNPTFQRFISEDPIGLSGGTNLYAYVANNPVNFVDPLGFDKRGRGWGSGRNRNGNGKSDGNGNGKTDRTDVTPPPPLDPNNQPPCGNQEQYNAAARNDLLQYNLDLINQTTGFQVDKDGKMRPGPNPGTFGFPDPKKPVDILQTGGSIADDMDTLSDAGKMGTAIINGFNNAVNCSQQ